MAEPVEARALTPNESSVLRRVVGALGGADATALDAQVAEASVAGGIPTLLNLAVGKGVPRASLPDGPIPVRAVVSTGELLVCVSSGFLDALEFAWSSGEMPTEMPPVDAIEIAP